jgi:hypothetical protein
MIDDRLKIIQALDALMLVDEMTTGEYLQFKS